MKLEVVSIVVLIFLLQNMQQDLTEKLVNFLFLNL